MPLGSLQRHIRAAMRVIEEYSLKGSFRCYRQHVEKFQLSSKMEDILASYRQFCIEKLGHGLGTLRVRGRNIRVFLKFLDSNRITFLKEIGQPLITKFILSQNHLKTTTLATSVSSIRSFLRYLCIKDQIPENLVQEIHCIRVLNDCHIPAVWKDDDVITLLSAIDRKTTLGKRDYAILLLAIKLGMRVSDIRALCLENILWREERIDYKQSKTGDSLSLPLTKEIGNAIIDYLQNGRPTSQYRQIFLRAKAPLTPFSRNSNLHSLIATYRKKTGLINQKQGSCGMHSLRHTLASNLLEANVPLETIAGILGHNSIETTRIYTKVSVEMLRNAALDPEGVYYA